MPNESTMRTAVVVGATGIIGRAIAAKLAEHGGWRVIGITRSGSTVPGVDEGIAVDLRDSDSADDVKAIDAQYGLDLHAASTWGESNDKIDYADVDPSHEDALVDALSHDPRVEHAEPMALYRASFVPNDPLYASKQWHRTIKRFVYG